MLEIFVPLVKHDYRSTLIYAGSDGQSRALCKQFALKHLPCRHLRGFAARISQRMVPDKLLLRIRGTEPSDVKKWIPVVVFLYDVALPNTLHWRYATEPKEHGQPMYDYLSGQILGLSNVREQTLSGASVPLWLRLTVDKA